MGELDNPVIVDFPLRGEWVAPNTPARKVPSHGTDMLGQRYAYDFFRTDGRKGMHFFKGSDLRYWLMGISASSCYCWKEDVYAPFDGEVVLAKDGLRERGRLHPVLDILSVVRNSIVLNIKALLKGPENIDLHFLTGNHVILKRDNVYAFFAHLHPNSITVKAGQIVHEGDVMGKVGHTGNSTAPHLHFQLMDSVDPFITKGIPCAFKTYEACEDGLWKPVRNGIPKYNEKIRYAK